MSKDTPSTSPVSDIAINRAIAVILDADFGGKREHHWQCNGDGTPNYAAYRAGNCYSRHRVT